jgi:hypothetical protein
VSRIGLLSVLSVLRAEDQARGPVLLRDVDRRALEGRGELGSHVDLQPVLLGDLVALGRRIGESEADRDLAGLRGLGEDPDAVRVGDVLAVAKLRQQRGSALSDLKHSGISLQWGTPRSPQDRYHPAASGSLAA